MTDSDTPISIAEARCPHCIKPITPQDHFCPHCDRPVSSHASIDPMGQVYSAGSLYRMATSRKGPSRLLLIGMWLIFGPSLFITVPIFLANLNSPLPATIGFVVCLLQVIILYRVTVNYVGAQREPRPSDDEVEVLEQQDIANDPLTREALSYEPPEALSSQEPRQPIYHDPLVQLGLISLIVILVLLSLMLINPTFFPPN